MKKVLTFCFVFLLAVSFVPAYASSGSRGASTTAMEKASDDAIFNRVGDWFATRGKSPQEKQAIIAERKSKRAAERAQKKLEKAQKEAGRQAGQAQKDMKAGARGLGKK